MINTCNTYITSTRDVSGLNRSALGRYVAWYKCFVSPVAKQMTSNTVVAKRDVMQMCLAGFSIQIERCCHG